jgi:hypothetical protein
MKSRVPLTKMEQMGWDAAIADAKRRIERLKVVISVCEEKKAEGEPWPGDQQEKRAAPTPRRSGARRLRSS